MAPPQLTEEEARDLKWTHDIDNWPVYRDPNECEYIAFVHYTDDDGNYLWTTIESDDAIALIHLMRKALRPLNNWYVMRESDGVTLAEWTRKEEI